MTARKHLKQLVRDRMRRTGERYTVARRHVVGRRPVVGAARRRPRRHGGVRERARQPRRRRADGEPLSEAMVLGVGGGLGAGYILWEFDAHSARRVLTLGFRRAVAVPGALGAGTAERLGLHAELHETGGAKAAAAALDAQLERGLPAIVWIDDERLGHRHEPDWRDGHGGPPSSSTPAQGDGFAIDDRSRRALDGPRRASRGGTGARRLLQAPPDRDRPRARRARRRPPARAVEEGCACRSST